MTNAAIKTFKELRKFKNWTQEAVSKKTGLTQAAISQFETGKRIPDLESFNRMVIFLKIPPMMLLKIFLKKEF